MSRTSARKPYFHFRSRFMTPYLGVMVLGFHQVPSPWTDGIDIRGIDIHVGALLFEFCIAFGIESFPS